MGQELVTLATTNDYAALAKLTGQDSGFSGSTIPLPRLRINRDGVDDEDKPIPIGTLCIVVDGKPVYAKTGLFRPLVNMFRYEVYDQEKKQTTNRTIFIPNFNEVDAIDELGGIRCGKLTKKQLAGLSEAQQKEVKLREKDTKVYRYVFGYVTLNDAADKEGNKAAVDNVLCYWRLSGDNFMPIGDVIDRLSKTRKPMQKHMFTTSLERVVKGATKYYVAKFDVDMTKAYPITEDTVKDIQRITDIIREENMAVVEKHQAALGKVETVSDGEVKKVASQILDAEFDDEVPWKEDDAKPV